VIKTQSVPFWRSKPSTYLVATCLAILASTYVLQNTQVGAVSGFTPPTPSFYLLLAGLVAAYLTVVEGVKLLFYRQYTHLLESG
jgi:P-type Mg2+ transporter